MRGYITRALATWLLVVSLLAPFASGWAMALGVAEGRILVICTGDGLQTIRIDENGDATQISDEATACILKSATDTATAIHPAARDARLLFLAEAPLVKQPPAQRLPHPAPLPRAPPMI